jgi:hypothetical protein
MLEPELQVVQIVEEVQDWQGGGQIVHREVVGDWKWVGRQEQVVEES